MIPPLPNIHDYDISADFGFLPPESPLARLPDPYYEPWELIVDDLSKLILTKEIRKRVEMLPELSTHHLKSESEWRRAYVILAFIAHAYIWGGEKPKDRLPRMVSIPFLRAAEHFEIPPIATYAAVCLWNFRPLFKTLPMNRMDNLRCLATFTGSADEQWFYLVSVAIEAGGAPTIPLMIAAMAGARRGDSETVTDCLAAFAERIDELRDLLGRMYEHCTPEAFYFRIRPFLAGSKNMAEAGLPHGVIYEDCTGTEEYRQYSGGSNAQSSLIQFFDIVLGVEHRPTGVKRPVSSEKKEGVAPPSRNNFIEEMRSYMPGAHRRFLEHLALVANIRDYVQSHTDDADLAAAYDECLRALSSFRDKHMQIVSRYIVIQSQQAKKKLALSGGSNSASLAAAASVVNLTHEPETTNLHSSPTTSFVGLARSEAAQHGLKGTGGTKLIPFLKQSRDETMEPATGKGVWRGKDGTSRLASFRARATPSGTPRSSSPDYAGLSDDHHGARACKVNELEDLPFVLGSARTGVGMAGDWEMDGCGGLCRY